MQWTQLEPGTLFAERRRIELGPIVLHRRRHDTAFKGDGEIPRGHTLFGFTGGDGCVTRWSGLDVTNEDVASTRQCVDVSATAPETLYAITVNDDAYRVCSVPDSTSAPLHDVPMSPALARSTHTRHLRAYVRSLLELGVRPGRDSKATICSNVLWLLSAAVGDEAEALEPTRPQIRRLSAVHRCLEYIEGRMGESVTLPDLSNISGLRPRSLINAFEAVTGTSPMAYLRARRLSRIRTVLESARNTKTRIIDVAADWGFWHMGHFTAAYRSMFGETPSQTLSRSPR